MRLKPQTYALTTVAYQRRDVFQRDAIAELCIETIFRYRDAGEFQFHAFVVMPNHVHAVLTPASDVAIERCAQLIKGGFSFAVRKEVTGEIWQEKYHPHRVTDEVDLRNQILYIVNNPVRKGLDGLSAYSYSAGLCIADGSAAEDLRRFQGVPVSGAKARFFGEPECPD